MTTKTTQDNVADLSLALWTVFQQADPAEVQRLREAMRGLDDRELGLWLRAAVRNASHDRAASG